MIFIEKMQLNEVKKTTEEMKRKKTLSFCFLDLSDHYFRKSEQVLLDADRHLCRVSIPKTENTVHYIQFRKPLTSERRFFFVELENMRKFFFIFRNFHIKIFNLI